MILLLDLAVRGSLVLGLALVALRLLRRKSAALRHSVLSAAIVCVALLPVLHWIAPQWRVPVWTELEDSPPSRGGVPERIHSSLESEGGVVDQTPNDLIPSPPRLRQLGTEPSIDAAATPPRGGGEKGVLTYRQVTIVLWLAGTTLALAVLLLHGHRLSRIASRATPLRQQRWSKFAQEICHLYGLRRRLRLLETSDPSVLATWGVLRPDVLLPATARHWPDDRVRVVLSHELAHIRRCDWLIQIGAELLRAAYWFNPLFWIACNRLRQESEQACDDAVLNLGVQNSDYAEHLLDLVRSLQEPASSWAVASSMARPSTLERRFRALLDPRANRSSMTRVSVVAVTAVFLGLTVPVAAFRAATVLVPVEIPMALSPPIAPPVGALYERPGGPRSASAIARSPENESPPQSAADAAIVEGIVVRADSNDPIAGAIVELQRVPDPGAASLPQPLTATSDSNGRYTLQNVAPGNYRLIATRAAGHVMAEYGQRSAEGRGTIMTLTAGQRFTDGRLAMTPTGSISGRIVDRDGEPVARAQVLALRPAYRDGRKYLNIIQSVQTNDLGEYRLFWLSPGSYHISARAEDVRRRQAPIFISPPGGGGTFEQSSAPVITRRTLENGEVVEEAFVVVYFPGTTDAVSASPIEVRAGENLRGADFALTSGQVRASHVRGRVIDGTTGQPARATIQIVPRVQSPNAAIATGTADQNGMFDIPGVVRGSYYLHASLSLPAGVQAQAVFGPSALAFLDVSDANVENITVTATPGFNIPGRILVEGRPVGQNDPELQRVRVGINRDPNLIGLPPVLLPGGAGGAPSGVVGSDGSFTLRNIGPGDYRLNVAPLPSTLYLKSIRLGGTDLLGRTVRLEKAPEGEIEVVLGSTAGLLEGRVVNEKGQGAANITVVLIPDAPRRSRLDMYKNVATDSTGRFRLQGVAPGDYRLFAWESIQTFAWQDAEFMRPYEGRGKSVHIGDGSKATAEVTLISR